MQLSVDVKDELARHVSELVADHLPIVPPELGDCHIEVEVTNDMVAVLSVRTLREVRRFEVRVNELGS